VSTRLLATQSDQRLLELMAKGHERAFEAVVHRYRRPLLAYCRRMGLADSRAEDVLQQSLLKAWLALCGGTEVRELRPWLYRIVHNNAVNLMRSAPEERGLLSDAACAELAAVDSPFEHRLAARDALVDVAALPPMQRDAILLTAVDGRSHQEVASALGVSHGAVRGLLYRARATLRSAAAAVVPQPLIDWASGSASRAGPTAARIAALSASGGGDAGGALLKGAAVAAGAALAAGAVLVPAHRLAGRPHDATKLSISTQAALRASPGASGGAQGAAARGAGGAAAAGGARSRLIPVASIGPVSPATPAHRAPVLRPRSVGSPVASTPGAQVVSPGVAPNGGGAVGTAAGAGHVVEAPPAGGPGGGAPVGGSEPPPISKPEGGTPPPQGEEPAGESGDGSPTPEAERKEREAEEARELKQREEELAHE
jgi:RNA polymerase sigma factor (sigma-70 family)